VLSLQSSSPQVAQGRLSLARDLSSSNPLYVLRSVVLTSDKKLRILVRVENPDYSHLLENLTSYPERNREHFRVGVGPHDS
jgi:hypothetical protein